MPIAFGIRNQEGERRTYSWSVIEGAGGEGVVRARGSLDVGAGARVGVLARASLACSGRRARVTVALDEPGRRIGFWARCPGSGAAS